MAGASIYSGGMQGFDEFKVLVPIEVSFRDTDAIRHANNAVYLTYFENGRMGYCRRLVDVAAAGTYDPDYASVPFVLARPEIDFRLAAHVGDRLTLGVRAGRLGTRSFDFAYRLVRDDDAALIAEGMTVQVMYDYVAEASMPMPAEFRAGLLAIEGDAPRPR